MVGDVLPFERPAVHQTVTIDSTIEHTFEVFVGKLARGPPRTGPIARVRLTRRRGYHPSRRCRPADADRGPRAPLETWVRGQPALVGIDDYLHSVPNP